MKMAHLVGGEGGSVECAKSSTRINHLVGATHDVARGRPQGPPLQPDFFTPSQGWTQAELHPLLPLILEGHKPSRHAPMQYLPTAAAEELGEQLHR